MLAAVLDTIGATMSIEELARPRPKAGEVLVAVAACGVCHTDLHVMKGEVAFPAPCVLGHEVSGTVAELGPAVAGLTIGQRVACSFIMPCGTCRHCVRGREDVCEKFFAYNRLAGTLYDGTSRLARPDGSPIAMYSMGGLAQFAVVPATAVFPLPDRGADMLKRDLKAAGIRPVRREGEKGARWQLVDFVDFVVHVFHEEERVYYSLERLWRDCPVIPLGAPGQTQARTAS
jgi:D-arabinose 1-dehydrogenase-like Zn-dependent alcohol dehydrogenase